MNLLSEHVYGVVVVNDHVAGVGNSVLGIQCSAAFMQQNEMGDASLQWVHANIIFPITFHE